MVKRKEKNKLEKDDKENAFSNKENLENNTNKNAEDDIKNDKVVKESGEEKINENVSGDKAKLEELSEDIEQLREEKLRLLAEMENLRKRSDRDRAESIKYGSANLARDILSPGDNLSRALDAIPENEKSSKTIKNLIDGLKMVQKEFNTILEKHGVKKIEALNSKFDHNFHQAMVEIENDEVEEGLVVQEMQSGYTMHDRLLRPSMVGVSRKLKQKED